MLRHLKQHGHKYVVSREMVDGFLKYADENENMTRERARERMTYIPEEAMRGSLFSILDDFLLEHIESAKFWIKYNPIYGNDVRVYVPAKMLPWFEAEVIDEMRELLAGYDISEVSVNMWSKRKEDYDW